jgi:putative transposase
MTSDAVSPRKRDQESGRQLLRHHPAAAGWWPRPRLGVGSGLALTGPNGLLKLFTKSLLETALGEELTEHLGHAKHRDEPGRESTNVRNGCWSKTVISDAVCEVSSTCHGIGTARLNRRS